MTSKHRRDPFFGPKPQRISTWVPFGGDDILKKKVIWPFWGATQAFRGAVGPRAKGRHIEVTTGQIIIIQTQSGASVRT